VIVEDAEGSRFALTRRTQGIDRSTLREGQAVVCMVHQTVVLSASLS